MAALQELSARLCLFTGALPLSAWKQSTVRVCRSQGNLQNYFSLSSSLLFVYGRQPSPRCLCTGRDDVRPVVIDRNLTDQSSIDVPDARETLDEKFTPKFTEKRSSSAADVVQNFSPKEAQCPNYLKLSDKELFANCNMDTFRASGPGGQHRNKTESAVRLRHTPTGLVSQAADDRSQHINRALALTRLRQVIALEVRHAVVLEGYTPSPEMLRILPSPKGSKKGSLQRLGPNHPEFVLGMKDLLDLLLAMDGSISKAGAILGLSTGALSKLVLSNNSLWHGVNKIRDNKGLKPLRQSN